MKHLKLSVYINIYMIALLLSSNIAYSQSFSGADFNGDGAADFAFIHDDAGSVTIKVARSNDSDSDFIMDQHLFEDWIVNSGDYSDIQRFFYADFNGDGSMDIAKLWDDGGQMSCVVYKAVDTDDDFISDAFVEETWATQLGNFKYSDKWFVGDVDGDFSADLIRAYKDGSSRSMDVFTANGTAFDTPVKWANSQGAYSSDRIWLSGDFNGDFILDIAVVSNNGGQVNIEVHTSNGTNGFSFNNWATNQGAIASNMKWVAADFNGDSMTDIARVWNDNGQVSIVVHSSTGSSFAQQNWTTQTGTFAREDKWLVGDFDGDFAADIARIRDDNGFVSIDGYMSDGASSFSLTPLLSQGYAYRDQNKYYVGDFDGDFVSDIAVTYANANNWYVDVVSGAAAVNSHYTGALGDYYTDQNISHQVWGDNFLKYNEVVGPVPVPPTGQESMLQEVLDAGNDLFLVKNAVYNVNDPLTYGAHYQRIETFDAMFISDFAILRQQIDNGERDRLIHNGGRDYIHLANVICDGNKYNLGQKAWVQGQGAMVQFGAADGHWVRRCMLYNSRTWSTCQIHEGADAEKSIVENNYVLGAGNGPRGNGRDLGEKGNQSEGGTGNTGWSDGFSIAARETVVRHNFIMDCTDVGVVLFGVPNGNCHDNYIFNYSRESLGGINLVDGIGKWDLGPDAQLPTSNRFDYTGLRVENNIINSVGARIQLGIPVSNQAWVPEIPEVFDFGGTGNISGNHLTGGAFGYGYIISNVRNLNFRNNTSDATHSGKGNGSKNAGNNADNNNDPDPAVDFIRDMTTIFGSDLGDAEQNWTEATKRIAHYLYMNRTPYNADGYHYYPYTDPEAEAIVRASYWEMLGREPTTSEVTTAKNQFLSNDEMIGDDLKRNLMNYQEFIDRYDNVGPESLHVFRTSRWRDSVIKHDGLTLINTGNYPDPKLLYADVHESLRYVDINSTHDADITFIQPALPTLLAQGDIVTVGVVVRNTGTDTWLNSAANPEKIAFASVGDDTTFGQTRYYLPNGVSVAPNETHTFYLNITAPPILYDPAVFTSTFPFNFKMMKESVGGFGESLTDQLGGTHQITVEHSEKPSRYVYDSVFVGIDLIGATQDNKVQPGSEFIAQVTFKNEVTITDPGTDLLAVEWSDQGRIYLGTLGDDMTWGTNRGFMDSFSVVKEDENYTFNVVLTAPTTPGTYGMQWRLLNPGNGWFGAISPSLNVTVDAGVTPPAYSFATFVSTNMPEKILPTSEFEVAFTMRNDGTTTWDYTGPGNGFSLGTDNSALDRTDAPNATYNTEFNDSPLGQEVSKLFDNDTNTAFATLNNNAWIQHRFGDGSAHVIKSYSITSAPSGSPLSNVLLNGSFESGSGNPDNWNMSNGPVTWSTEQTVSGNRSLKLTGDGATFINPTHQTISVSPNTDYEISFWLLTENMTAGPIVFDTNDKPTPQTEVQFVIQSGNKPTTWTEYRGTWNSGSETQLRLRIFAETAFNGVAYFDYISVVDLSAGGGEEFDPASWTISGSNDGSNWNTLGSESGIDFPTRRERKEFDLNSNNTAYEYYRLDMTNNSGGILQLSEVELFTAPENHWNTPDRIPVTAPVAPGEIHTFRVTATAPAELGDYPFSWQMVQDPVEWFGATTPNVKIEVTPGPIEGNSASFVGYNISSGGVMTTEVRPGVQFGVEMTFMNSGTTTWGAGYATGNIDEANNPWTVQQLSLPSNVTVAPGETYTQFITVTAPDITSDPSFFDGKTYDFQRRMLQQGVEWFGLSSTAATITVHAAAPDAPPPATSSAFISYANIPNESAGQGSIKPGAGFNMEVVYQNNGITPWNLGFQLGEQPVDVDEWSTGRYILPAGVTVNSGEQYTFRLSATAPLVEGAYTFSRRMLQPAGAGWFGEISTPITINVSSVAPDVDFDDAAFRGWNAPTGTLLDQAFTVDITFENMGNTTWSDANGYALATNDPIWTGGTRIGLGSTVVAPGETHTFTVQATAPSADGSYSFQWGMVQDGGIGSFGNLTPTRLISVSSVINGNASQFVGHNAPPAVTPGSTFQVEFTFRNVGTTTWDSDQINGGQNGYKSGSTGPNPASINLGGDGDNEYFGINRVNVPNGVSVATGEEYTFTATLTAPSALTDPAILPAGLPYISGTSYPFHRRMLQEGVQWFGDVGVINIVVADDAPVPPPPPSNDAAFVSMTGVPSSIRAGVQFEVTVIMENTGSQINWTAEDGYFLGEQDPQDGSTWRVTRKRVDAGVTVAPGEQYAFVFTPRAPAVAGDYPFQRRMLQDGVQWFGELSPLQTVTVTPNVNAPVWTSATITKSNAVENAQFQHDLTVDVSDADGDALEFDKVSTVHSWINVNAEGLLYGTPDATHVGQTFSIQLEATDGSNVTAVTIEFTVEAAPADPAVAWVDRFDNTLAANDKAGDADPDGDGFSNSYEYFFGMNPIDSDNARQPIASGIANAPTITYTRQATAAYVVETSTDLVNWSPASVSVLSGPTSNGDGTETVTVSSDVDFTTATKQFFRIQANQ